MQSFLTDRNVLSFGSSITDVNRSMCLCVLVWEHWDVGVTYTKCYQKDLVRWRSCPEIVTKLLNRIPGINGSTGCSEIILLVFNVTFNLVKILYMLDRIRWIRYSWVLLYRVMKLSWTLKTAVTKGSVSSCLNPVCCIWWTIRTEYRVYVASESYHIKQSSRGRDSPCFRLLFIYNPHSIAQEWNIS